MWVTNMRYGIMFEFPQLFVAGLNKLILRVYMPRKNSPEKLGKVRKIVPTISVSVLRPLSLSVFSVAFVASIPRWLRDAPDSPSSVRLALFFANFFAILQMLQFCKILGQLRIYFLPIFY